MIVHIFLPFCPPWQMKTFAYVHTNKTRKPWIEKHASQNHATRPWRPLVKRKQTAFPSQGSVCTNPVGCFPKSEPGPSWLPEWQQRGENRDCDFSPDQVESCVEWKEQLSPMASQKKKECPWKSIMEASEAMDQGLPSWPTSFKWGEVFLTHFDICLRIDF